MRKSNKTAMKRFAIRQEDGGYFLYFLNRYGYVVRLGRFGSYGAALWFLHDMKGETELMTFDRLCAVALGVQSCFAEWGVSCGL